MSELSFNTTWEDWTKEFFAPHPEKITGREREVLYHAARGNTLRDVGHRLGISEQTVKNHLSSVHAKLQVSSTIAAVWKMRHELEDNPSEVWKGWGI